jgi:hypothetical protein
MRQQVFEGDQARLERGEHSVRGGAEECFEMVSCFVSELLDPPRDLTRRQRAEHVPRIDEESARRHLEGLEG